MKLSLVLLLCLTGVDPVAPKVVRHDYYPITTPATWNDAKTYCRSKYADLATVQSVDDWQRLNAEAESKGLPTTGWVGLYIDVVDWYWSALNQVLLYTLSNWGPGQPNNAGGIESCVAINPDGYWDDRPCRDLKPVICSRAAPPGFVAFSSYLLSWWGGQTYCRTYYTDLAMVTTITENNALQQIASVQGTSWIGLFRDVWMWSDGTIPMALMWNPGFPNNVDHNDNCASVNNSMFVDRQCNSLFSFFCHIPYTVKFRVVKLQFQGDESVFDPAVQSAILQQIVQKLKEHGIWRETTVTWRVHPDGNIFHKKHIRGPLQPITSQFCISTGIP